MTYNLGKSNEYKALHGETLDIYSGEYIILFGPSGCGKSTLLYAILGALPPSGGDIRIKGENPYTYTDMEMVRFQQSTIGIIYQSFNLIPSLSVLDNVALPMIFGGVAPAQREKRGMQLLKQFGVAHVANKFGSHLSGGQMQRVAVARSLINDPEILLADEPVGNLDSISAEQVMDMLAEVNEKGRKTIVLVTHDAKYLPYAHRVFYVRDGRLERDVPNPEKAQIKKSGGKGVVTEIERLARLFPYDTVDGLRVKSIMNYLSQDITFEQIERLEKLITRILQGRVDEKGFFDTLCEKFSGGGVGVSKAIARVYTDRMKQIIEQSLDVKRYRRKLELADVADEGAEFIERLRRNVLDAYPGQINRTQLERLEDAIGARLSGVLRKDGFEKRMEMPVEDGGMGIDGYWAHTLTRYLEKLIAQGIKQ
ncbi:MAG: ABC transporter ATP-binding protein [bacterium]|nr:ABC transporter ATP-binding protein [bacterium]